MKFIQVEVSSTVSRFDSKVDDWVSDYISEPIYINVDRIERIYPQGNHCSINFIGESRLTVLCSVDELLSKIHLA